MANTISIVLKGIASLTMPAMLLGICESSLILWNTINKFAILKQPYDFIDLSAIFSYIVGFIGIIGGT